MGRTIYAEEHLRTYLTFLAKPDEYVIGLILGQVFNFYIFDFSYQSYINVFSVLTYAISE